MRLIMEARVKKSQDTFIISVDLKKSIRQGEMVQNVRNSEKQRGKL